MSQKHNWSHGIAVVAGIIVGTAQVARAMTVGFGLERMAVAAHVYDAAIQLQGEIVWEATPPPTPLWSKPERSWLDPWPGGRMSDDFLFHARREQGLEHRHPSRRIGWPPRWSW